MKAYKSELAERCTKEQLHEAVHGKKPQTKPLSDEDIDAIGDEVSSLIDTYAGRREFARAILKKASEK